MIAVLAALVRVSWTPTGLYVALHVGDPGGSGLDNPSAVTARSEVFLGTPAGGSIGLTGTPPSWTTVADEIISHISVWDFPAAGHFLWSSELNSPKTVGLGDTIRLLSCGVGIGSLAA
jgi:hypothetical protein